MVVLKSGTEGEDGVEGGQRSSQGELPGEQKAEGVTLGENCADDLVGDDGLEVCRDRVPGLWACCFGPLGGKASGCRLKDHLPGNQDSEGLPRSNSRPSHKSQSCS